MPEQTIFPSTLKRYLKVLCMAIGRTLQLSEVSAMPFVPVNGSSFKVTMEPGILNFRSARQFVCDLQLPSQACSREWAKGRGKLMKYNR